MTGHCAQILLAAAMRPVRVLPRSRGGWKNEVVSMPWHAAWLCQTQFSTRGSSGNVGVSTMVGFLFERVIAKLPIVRRADRRTGSLARGRFGWWGCGGGRRGSVRQVVDDGGGGVWCCVGPD